MTLIERASDIARQTPEQRNRYVDFLRVLAICAVVVGHWLVIDVKVDTGLPRGGSALADVRAAHWLTWAFQVIPIFFLVGGYANAVSWRSHRGRRGDWASWLHRRSIRLLWPTAIFVATGLVAAPAAAWWGAAPSVLDQAAEAVAIILWFLAAYLGVAALTPAALAAHERWGLGFVGVLGALVAVADVLRFTGPVDVVACANYALVWGSFHQLGFAWEDGTLTSGARPIGLGAVSAAVLIGLVVLGPYPVSMVAVPGAEVQNTGPPTLALLFLGLTQAGLLLAIRGRLSAFLHRSRPWTVVVAGNLVIMSMFLWHVVPILIFVALLAGLGLALPGPAGSVEWFLFRPAWVVVLMILLLPIVLVAARVERPPKRLEDLAGPRENGAVALALGFAGVAAASVGLARFTLEGFWVAETGGPPTWAASGFFLGFVLIVAAGALARRPSPKER